MPNTFSAARLVKWCIAERQAVSKGQIVAELDSEKGLMEIQAPESGIIQRLHSESALIQPNTVIALIHTNDVAYTNSTELTSIFANNGLLMLAQNPVMNGIRGMINQELQPIKDTLDKITKHLGI
jgi:pyruvate/2-oxoglutarate dehydrogenase complex dihydrolipoamide acyltransferase (E2) component